MKKIIFLAIILLSANLNAGAIGDYERACNSGSGANCHALGNLYAWGAGTIGGKSIQVQKDNKKAAIYYRKACDSDDGMGCSSLGYMYERGRGVSQNIEKAKDAYSKSCKLGDGSGCTSYKSLDQKY